MGDAGPPRGRFQLLVHHLARGAANRDQINEVDVLVPERAVFLRQPGVVPQAQDDQALELTNLDRVIHNPDPILRLLERPRELMQTDSQQPSADARVAGERVLPIQKSAHQSERRRTAAEGPAAVQHESQSQTDRSQRIVVSGHADLPVVRLRAAQRPFFGGRAVGDVF